MPDESAVSTRTASAPVEYPEHLLKGANAFGRTLLQTALPSMVLVVLFIAVVYGLMAPTIEANFLSQKKELCRRLVEAVVSDLDSRQEDVAEGLVNAAEMQQRAIKRLRRQRYGQEHKDYVWIVGPDGRFLMHPYRPDLEGADPATTLGPDGEPLSLLLGRMQQAIADSADGFLDYRWHWKDNLDLLVNKVSYVSAFEPWGWIVGTGVYVDDIQQEAASWRGRIIGIGLMLTMIAFGISLALSAQAQRHRQRELSYAERLFNSERQYRVLVENSVDVPFSLDHESRFTYINPRLNRLGIEAETLLGESFLALVCRTDRNRIEKVFREAVSHGGQFEFLFRLVRSGGSAGGWVEARGAVSHNEAQQPVSVNGILRDVNERQEAQQALQESEENLRITLRSIGDAVIATDVRGRVKQMNPIAEELTGWTFKEARGKLLSEVFNLVHAISEQPVTSPVSKVLATGEIIGMSNHTLLLSKDGHRRQIADSAAPIRNSEGRIVGVVMVFRDVTEEYAMQQTLRAREEQFRAIFETSPLGMVITSMHDWTVLRVNRTFEQIIALPSIEQHGLSLPEIGLQFDQKQYSEFRHRLESVGLVEEAQGRIRRQNGHERQVVFSSTAIEFEGEPAVLTAVMDVTQTRTLEDQLRQAQKMDVVGQLAGGIAHDFNNMLGAVLGNAELLAMELQEQSELQQYVGTILRGAQRASELTRKLLAFSRKGKMLSTPADVHQTINESVALLERSIDPRITIQKRFNANERIVIGDPTLLQNVFMNLAVNARDAMPNGGTLTFSTSNVELDAQYCRDHPFNLKPGVYVEIDVSDTGWGMSHDVLERVFEPFFTTKPVGKGTGLGLAAVYGTIKEHNGAIFVSSEPGIGSVFKVFLPVGLGQQLSAADESDVIQGTGTILVVDDEMVVRRTARSLLLSLGYDVLMAADGDEAVEVYRRHQPDIRLVLLDMVMPILSGRDTFLKLRELDPGVAVLFTSGFSYEQRIDDLLAMGARGFVQKPYRRSSLSREVHQAIHMS